MGTSPSNFVGLFDASAPISPPQEPHDAATRVQANGIETVRFNLSSAPDRISRVQACTATSPQAGTPEDDKIAKLDPNIVPAYSPAVSRLRLVNASMTAPQSGPPDAWMPTPLLRRPGDPLSSRTKFLIASATAALLSGYFSGYFVLRNSDRPDGVAIVPQSKFDLPSVASLPSPDAAAPSAEARGTTVESRTERDVQTASLQPTARLDIKLIESGTAASPPQTLPEKGQQLLMASPYDSKCYPSASAVRLNHPGARPSWTMNVPSHEGTKCWYAATQTVAEADTPSARARNLAAESRVESEVQTPSLQPTVRLDIKPAESAIEVKPPQTFPESGKQPLPSSGYGSTCYPSASAVRLNHPGAWPSWTLRAPGHEGTRCWYVGVRTTSNDRRGEMAPQKETVGTTENSESPGALFGVQ